MSDRFDHILKLLKDFTKGSEFEGKVFIFGGYLRDSIVGIEPKDIDIIITDDGARYAIELAKSTGDYEEGNNPISVNNATRLCLCRGTPHETKVDISSHFKKAHETVKDSLICSSIYHRDFTLNNLYMDVATGEVIDPTEKAIKSFVNREFYPTLENYDCVFKGYPVRLYRMFRIQSTIGFKIPEHLMTYATEHWWLGNFIERERVIIEMNRIRQGPFAELALDGLAKVKLNPCDLNRADVFIGEGWHECEPGMEPSRYTEEPHARWTGANPVIYLNPSTEAIEFEFSKSGYRDFDTILFSCDNGDKKEHKFEGNTLKIPTVGAKRVEFEIPTFNPSKCFDTKDDRNLGIYVAKINTYSKGIKTENLIDHVPYYVEL